MLAAIVLALASVMLQAEEVAQLRRGGSCASCGPTAPPPVAAPAAVAAPASTYAVTQPKQGPPVPADGWNKSIKFPGWWFWMAAGEIWSWFHPDTNVYQEVTYPPTAGPLGVLSPPKSPPWTGPQPKAPVPPQPVGPTAEVNYGVDRINAKPKDGLGGDRWIINGLEVTESDGKLALATGTIPDDRHKWRLGVLGGTDLQRTQTLALLQTDPELKALADNSLIQIYPDPKNWQLDVTKLDADQRFQRSHFAVYFMGPAGADGKSRHLASAYEADAVSLRAAMVEEKRRADVNYDPNKVGDGKTKPLGIPEWVTKEHVAFACVAGAALALLYWKKQKAKPKTMTEDWSVPLEPRAPKRQPIRRGLSELAEGEMVAVPHGLRIEPVGRVTLDKLIQEAEQEDMEEANTAKRLMERIDEKKDRRKRYFGTSDTNITGAKPIN